MKTLIIIPAYNESESLPLVIKNILSLNLPDTDILVVDDGSSDKTFLLAKNFGVKVLRHCLNRGQGASLKTGIDFCLKHDYQVAVFFDADGQMDHQEIPLLVKNLSSDCQVVLGSRRLGQTINMPKARRLVKYLALIFTRLTTGLKLTDTHNGFQAWNTEALKKIELYQDGYAHASQLLQQIAKHRLKYCEFPVTIKYTDYSRRRGQSLWGAIKILWDLLIK